MSVHRGDQKSDQLGSPSLVGYQIQIVLSMITLKIPSKIRSKLFSYPAHGDINQ